MVVIIQGVESTWVNTCYHIACTHPAVSVSSVAGSVFMVDDDIRHGSVDSVCIEVKKQGFLYDWSL